MKKPTNCKDCIYLKPKGWCPIWEMKISKTPKCCNEFDDGRWQSSKKKKETTK